MNARRAGILIGALLLVPAAPVVATPSPPLRTVVTVIGRSGVVKLTCMGSYRQALALGFPGFSAASGRQFAQTGGTLLNVIAPPRTSWVSFCVTLHRSTQG